MIIDFHTHTFPAGISASILRKLSRMSHTQYFTDGSVDGLVSSMKEAGITYSVSLPVMTRTDQVEKVNSALIADREKLEAQGILTFGGMHPDYENYRQELARLWQNGIRGIKIHPAYQGTDIDDIRMMRIIECASGLGFVILTHAGIDIGIYDHNYASVDRVLNVIDTLHPKKLVLAHMGGWGCWEDVERDLAGADVWFDTAFAIGPVTPDEAGSGIPYLKENLSDEAFVRLVRKHGSDKILFATDSPWESQKDYVARIRRLELTSVEQKRIFYQNALRILDISFQ